MPDGLLRSDPSAPGLIRRRCGRGFRYLDAAGLAVSEPEVLARVEGLVIPPR
ncbi:MAG: topoisomerase [Pseudonocardiales bacterium]|jgi:DNA topoisomerase-1|nr:topoisomerase [Pseudonocardiales bacterium]